MMPKAKGSAHTWEARTDEIEFLKGKGGFYGVELILTVQNAKKLARDLTKCVAVAEKNNKERVEVAAHWGKYRVEKGFLLRWKVHNPRPG